jgi:Polysaccharide biosynthesis/export protein
MNSSESTLTIFRSHAGALLVKAGVTILAILVAISVPYAPGLLAQDTRRAEATRAELQASLAELEQYVASSGYSGRLRDQKRREAALIRERLDLGDIQVGDSVELAVVGEKDYSGTFPVVAGRVLSLPGLPDIPLRGVLRSEARDYLTGKLAKYIRDPQVKVRTTIRLSVFGSVGRPGFYQVPADALATDVFMKAGIAQDANPNKAFVRRGDEVIWPPDSFHEAMQKGLTLDQLNLRAGDELVFDPHKRAGGISVYNVVALVGAATSLTYLITHIF